MFQVEHYPSENSHGWLVRQFELFRLDDSFLVEKYVPRPDVSLIFHFGNVPFVINDKEVMLKTFFATPIITKSLMLKLQGRMDTFVVVCKPTVLSRIFELDFSVSGQVIELPQGIFNPLWKQLARTENIQLRIQLFSDFIDDFHRKTYHPDTIDLLYDKILECSITKSLSYLLQECPACERTLQRSFKRRTGVSPKTLARIVRIDYLWSKIINENAIDYQELVFDGKYFDQAHFINDFKSIIGGTPSYFFNRNQNILKLISGRKPGQY